jgi:hypothetical protein
LFISPTTASLGEKKPQNPWNSYSSKR